MFERFYHLQVDLAQVVKFRVGDLYLMLRTLEEVGICFVNTLKDSFQKLLDLSFRIILSFRIGLQ